MSGNQRRNSIMVLTLLAAGLALGGCYTEGGPGYSADQHVYVSRPWQPWTVTLRDTRSGQEFWSKDVPVGKKLVVKFVEGEGTGDKYTPDLMRWALVDEGRETGVQLSSSIPVPGSDSRRLEPSLRTSPELPESMVRATKGTVQPTKVQTVRPPTVTVPAPSEEPMEPLEPLDEPAPVP